MLEFRRGTDVEDVGEGAGSGAGSELVGSQRRDGGTEQTKRWEVAGEVVGDVACIYVRQEEGAHLWSGRAGVV